MALAGDAPCHLPQRGWHFGSLPEGGYVGAFSPARGPHPAAARPPSPCAGKAITPHPSCGGRDTPHDTFSSRRRLFGSLPEGGYVGAFSPARGPHPAAARPPSPCAGKAMTPHSSCGGRDTPHDTFSSRRRLLAPSLRELSSEARLRESSPSFGRFRLTLQRAGVILNLYEIKGRKPAFFGFPV